MKGSVAAANRGLNPATAALTVSNLTGLTVANAHQKLLIWIPHLDLVS
jgi:hypothetical protein